MGLIYYIMPNELSHHGVKGMKWGVRRYQKPDGSLTSEGRKRYGVSDRRKEVAKKVAKGVAVTGVVALTAYGLSNPKVRNVVANLSKKSFNSIRKTAVANAPKAKEFVKKAGKKAVKNLGESTERVGKAMTDAALMSIGTIAIARLARKLHTDETTSQAIKDRNKIILDSATAGISEATKARASNTNNGKNGSSNDLLKKTRDLKSEVGNPKGIFGADAEKAYQNLFKMGPTDEQRAIIKAMRKNGYSVDQIEKYVFHGDDFVARSMRYRRERLNELYHRY